MVEECWNALELQLKGWRSRIMTDQVLSSEKIKALDSVLVRSKNN